MSRKKTLRYPGKVTLKMSVTNNSKKKNRRTGANGTMIVIKIEDGAFPLLEVFETVWADHDDQIVELSLVPIPGMKPVRVQDDGKINISTKYDLKLFDRREAVFYLDSKGNYFARHEGRAEPPPPVLCPTCGKPMEPAA